MKVQRMAFGSPLFIDCSYEGRRTCSAFIDFILRQVCIRMPPTSDEKINADGQKVDTKVVYSTVLYSYVINFEAS